MSAARARVDTGRCLCLYLGGLGILSLSTEQVQKVRMCGSVSVEGRAFGISIRTSGEMGVRAFFLGGGEVDVRSLLGRRDQIYNL